MSLIAALQAMNPNIDIEYVWDEPRWRPVDPEGQGQAVAFELTWFEDNPLHDGPEPFGDEGPLDDLLPKVAEILGYDNLLPSCGIHVKVSNWALAYGQVAS